MVNNIFCHYWTCRGSVIEHAEQYQLTYRGSIKENTEQYQLTYSVSTTEYISTGVHFGCPVLNMSSVKYWTYRINSLFTREHGGCQILNITSAIEDIRCEHISIQTLKR